MQPTAPDSRTAPAAGKKTAGDVLARAKEALAKKANLKRKLDELKSQKAAPGADSEAPKPTPSTQAAQRKRAAFELIQAPEGASYARRRRTRALQFLDEEGKREREEARRQEEAATASAPAAQVASRREPPPDVEWWDAKILVNKQSYPEKVLDETILMDKLTHYVEHPEELESVVKEAVIAPAPLKLTRKEVKKLRTQRRLAREEEKQQLIQQGLIEPPKPKVKLSNLMRVLSADATADPTAIEKKVAKEMAKRHAAHEDRNLARMLSPAERRQKKMKKLLDAVPGDSLQEVKVAVYRINHAPTSQNRFKIEVNAFENHLTGTCVVGRDMTIVVVEGGPKTLRRYEHLMLRRIKWRDEDDENDENDEDDPPCKLVWTGVVAEKAFSGKFRCVDGDPKAAMQDKGVAHYFELCGSVSSAS